MMKKQRIQNLILFFYLMCLIGYLWELLVFSYENSFRYNIWELLKDFHGVLHGPWVPIYGFGVLLMLVIKVICKEKIGIFFVLSVIVSAVLEYATSWALELLFHARWWDYSYMRFHINGRVCLAGCLLFGAGGLFAAYVVEPWFRKVTDFLPERVRDILCVLISILFFADFIVSMITPNIGIGVELTEGQGWKV